MAIVDHFCRKWSERSAHPRRIACTHHAPFAWGETVAKAVEHAIVLEEVARLALHTEALNPSVVPAPNVLVDKHFERKHGATAYYGQPEPTPARAAPPLPMREG